MGVDIVGGILYFECIMDDGVKFVWWLCEIVVECGLRVDMYCDEIDDFLLWYIEILVYEI